MTRQTRQPIGRALLNTFNRRAVDLVDQMHRGQIDLNPPYQRGPVWTEDQQVALVRSLLAGLPIPTLIFNQRPTGPVLTAVIDGKQRLIATLAWFDGELAVPASWFAPDMVASTVETDDGPYVTFDGLTEHGQASASRAMLPVGEATFLTVREEAEVYLLVNGAGTPQTDEDLANAAQVARED
jgi:hypothetical protein